MIKEYLTRDFKLNKLYNSYLINSDDLKGSLNEIIEFIGENFFLNQDVLKHPDIMLVQRAEGNVKNISVDQIRKMQDFLYKTSVISGQKFAIIYEAEDMNINAANSCLKLLEDTPKNTHIFLVTTNSALILPTIRSRCAKINCAFSIVGNVQVEDYYIKPLLKTTEIDEHILYLKDFATKDRKLWIEFAANTQKLVARTCYKLAGKQISLSTLEMQFLEQMMPVSLAELAQKYDKLVKLTEDTINFDLELRASYILLVDTLLL